MTLPDWTTLRIFLASLELGSVTRAAARCGIAVSAAARRMQDLEADTGIALLERTAKGVRPTAAGDLFAAHARTLLLAGERLREDLQAARRGGTGSVRLSATPSGIAGHDLPERLSAFGRDHPGITVEMAEDTSLAALRHLAEGRADLAVITTAQVVPEDLEAAEWRRDRLLAVMPGDHPSAGREAIGFAEVLDHPLVGVLPSGALSLLLEEAAGRVGRRPSYGFRVASPDAAIRLVAAGHGITVMPDGVFRVFAGLGLVGVPLADDWAVRRLRLVSRPHATLPVPVRLLREHLLATPRAEA